ncbi:MAG: imelysin family protein [Oceanospirillaceae bacterium]|nr:imelysin family protein [Oceanospirillaceae bacterium]
MKKITLIACALLSSLTHSTVALASAPSEIRWQQFNRAAIASHIIPKYQNLAEQSAALSVNIEVFCSVRSDLQLSAAKQQFKLTLQAWQSIQHIQFGPVTLLMRNFSLQYWPDKKNLGGRQLNTLLKQALGEDTQQAYDDEFFARASVAVKGYPAMERLLFDQKLLPQLTSNSSYCPLLEAISKHVTQNTQAIVSEWQLELKNYQNYSEDDLYLSAKEAATEILKALVEPIEAISDGKIAKPLGEQLSKMRWRKSESWRSGQSIANIRTNLNSLHHLYSGITEANLKTLLIEADEEPLAQQIDRQFKELVAALETVAEPTGMQYVAAEFAQLLHIKTQLKHLSDSLLASMKPLEISLGFNRRDGD